MKLSIIIPAYNEEKRIKRTLEEYCKFFREKKKKKRIENFEIIVVLNACKDNTLIIVKNLQKKFKEIRYLDFEQGGKGFAITEGFKEALKKENKLIGFVDADMATSPEAFYELVQNIENYEGCIASRSMKGAKANFSFKRKLTHKGFNSVVRFILLLPYHDTQCGAKIFKRSVIENIIDELEITKWAFDVDLLYKIKKKNFKIKEIPTVWEDKAGSNINTIKTTIQMFLGVIRLRMIFSPFKKSIRLYDKIPQKLKIKV